MSPIRSIVAVLGGIGLVSLVAEALEFTLVAALSGGAVTDMTGYFAVRNRPGVLAAKLGYNSIAAVLGGYMTAKVAGSHELQHAVVAALIQTAALVWGFTQGEYAGFTPIWMRIVLVLSTGPAMMMGAAVRARARRQQEIRD